MRSSAFDNPVMWRVETVLAARKGARGPVNFGSGVGPGPFVLFGGPFQGPGEFSGSPLSLPGMSPGRTLVHDRMEDSPSLETAISSAMILPGRDSPTEVEDSRPC